MTTVERMRAELEILGLDVSQHAVAGYDPFLDALGVTRSRDLLRRRSRAELLVAGVKVATQTPPIKSGRRVVFLTLDDGTLAVVSNSRHNGRGYDVRLEAHGSLDAVAAGLDDTLPLRSADPAVRFPAGPPATFFMDRLATAFRAELETFIRVTRGPYATLS